MAFKVYGSSLEEIADTTQLIESLFAMGFKANEVKLMVNAGAFKVRLSNLLR